MGYRLIYYLKFIIQRTLFEFMGLKNPTMEEIDLRTQEGKQRYKEIFGKPPCMDRAEPAPERSGSGPPAKSPTCLDNLLAASSERGRRLIAGYLATAHGKGGIQKVAAQTGLDAKTIRKGKREITSRAQLPKGQVRRAGGGRHSKSQADPTYHREMQEIVDHDIGGDPTGCRPSWFRKTLRWVKGKLLKKGIKASPSTIRNTMKGEFHLSLKKNKKNEGGRRHPDREAQFQYIDAIVKRFLAEGKPIVSIDAKKKELIGNFKNDGRAWRAEACKVLDHDFPSAAEGKLVPFGIYTPQENRGHVYCGTSHETSEFIVDCIVRYWQEFGAGSFPGKTEILILCDCGGANGYRRRSWKAQLQAKVANRLGLTVTVCHYPTGASKYNPVEHRLFSYISINWAGEPLTSYDKALGCIRSTTTEKGLKVDAELVEKEYRTGLKVSDAEMEALRIERAEVCPNWNYTIKPQA